MHPDLNEIDDGDHVLQFMTKMKIMIVFYSPILWCVLLSILEDGFSCILSLSAKTTSTKIEMAEAEQFQRERKEGHLFV